MTASCDRGPVVRSCSGRSRPGSRCPDSLPTISTTVGQGSPTRPPISSTGAAEPVDRVLSVASVHDEVMKIRHVPELHDRGRLGPGSRPRDVCRAPLPTAAPLLYLDRQATRPSSAARATSRPWSSRHTWSGRCRVPGHGGLNLMNRRPARSAVARSLRSCTSLERGSPATYRNPATRSADRAEGVGPAVRTLRAGIRARRRVPASPTT